MAQRKRNPEKTRAELLRAAGDLLVEEGLRGFTVHGVAEKAGFGKPLIYRYLGARGAVLDALVHIRVAEAEKILSSQTPPKEGPMSKNVYRQVMFARFLAGEPVLRALFRALLSGDLGPAAGKALDGLVPCSGARGEPGAAEAFLLGGISYVLLLRDSQTSCSGIPIQTPNDLAKFERAFIRFSSQI